jgi:hypothetical protein
MAVNLRKIWALVNLVSAIITNFKVIVKSLGQ